jgi:D-sedoheptulose 7-phosphate isomerase
VSAEAVLRKVRESASVQAAFFAEQAENVSRCATALAERFARGGRLLTLGNGGSACDAQHVAVEFMHPVFEKRAALPAIALPSDTAMLTAVGNDQDFSLGFARQLELLAGPNDAVLAISTSGKSRNVIRALQVAKERSLLSVAFTGRDGGKLPGLADHCFVVPSFSVHRIQETHAVLIHLLWDLVHLTRGEEDVI